MKSIIRLSLKQKRTPSNKFINLQREPHNTFPKPETFKQVEQRHKQELETRMQTKDFQRKKI